MTRPQVFLARQLTFVGLCIFPSILAAQRNPEFDYSYVAASVVSEPLKLLKQLQKQIEENPNAVPLETLARLPEIFGVETPWICVNDDAGKSFSSLNLHKQAAELFAKLSPKAKQTYRSFFEKEAAHQLKTALEAGDFAALFQVAYTYRYTQASTQALRMLAHDAFENSQADDALAYFKVLEINGELDSQEQPLLAALQTRPPALLGRNARIDRMWETYAPFSLLALEQLNFRDIRNKRASVTFPLDKTESSRCEVMQLPQLLADSGVRELKVYSSLGEWQFANPSEAENFTQNIIATLPPNLASLSLISVLVTGKQVQQLLTDPRFSQLKKLSLSQLHHCADDSCIRLREEIDKITFDIQEPLANLEVLELWQVPLDSDAVLSVLQQAKNLQHLTLQGYLTKDVETLQKLCAALPAGKLKSLDLSEGHIGEQGLHILANCPFIKDIESLNLGLTAIYSTGDPLAFRDLAAKLPKLTNLNISNNLMGPIWLGNFCKAGPLPKLEVLDLSNNQLGEEGMRVLLNCGWLQDQLTELNLSETQLGEPGLELLLKEGKFKKLKYISLVKNYFFSNDQIVAEKIRATSWGRSLAREDIDP